MSDERDILAVRRVSEMPIAPLAVGTTQCSGCGEECWLAQASAALMARRADIRVLCMQCVGELPEDSVDAIDVPPGSVGTLAHVAVSQPEFIATVRSKMRGN